MGFGASFLLTMVRFCGMIMLGKSGLDLEKGKQKAFNPLIYLALSAFGKIINQAFGGIINGLREKQNRDTIPNALGNWRSWERA